MSAPGSHSDSRDRGLRLQCRADLICEQQIWQGRQYWVIKDPLTLKYYRFEEEEFAIMQWLDGRKSAAQLCEQFNREFAPQKLNPAELLQFAGMLHRSGLLVSDAAGQGSELWQRDRKQKSRAWRQSLTQILSIRFKGFDPDALLTVFNRNCGWIFSKAAGWLWGLLLLSALLLIGVEWEAFARKLPTFQDFFAGGNWFWLAAILGITKVLHELGHGIACKRFGGHCHEMGVMFLVLTPCLYCNVSDAWMLPSKWRRMMVAAAGMYVELALAAIATWIWWWSEPGLVQQLALNVMFVCSVTTLIFNVNPLMRYDGYYILADWLEIPNLRQKATTLSLQAVNQYFLGMTPRPDPFLPTRHRWLFVAYTVGAIAYRWLITFSIFWFLYRVLEPYGFQIVGQLLALMALYGLIGMPIQQVFKYFSVPGRWQAVKTKRLSLAAAGVAGVLVIGLAVPLPYYVNCSCYLEPHQADQVFVELPGTLAEVYVEPNSFVKQGQPLMRLASAKLDRELIQMAGETSLAFAHHEAILRNAASSDPQSQQELDVARTTYNHALQRWTQREQTAERLTIKAPRDGWILPPPRKTKPSLESGELPQWYGSPLEPRNIGATLESQTLVGTVVGDPQSMQCVLAIDQSQIEFLEPGQQVEVWIRQLPNHTFQTTIDQVSRVKLETIPQALASQHGGDIVAEPTVDQQQRPASPTYAASGIIASPELPLVVGATGVAKIRVGSRTLGQRIWRSLMQTFRFEL